jgi:hypothetical protein
MFSGNDGQVVSAESMESAIDEILNPPFFGRKSVVLEMGTVSRDDVCSLKDIIDMSSEFCVLVVKGKGASSTAKKDIKSVGEPLMRLFDYSKKPSFKDMVSFACKRVRDVGGEMSNDTASLLVSIAGGEYWSLAQEIDKILSVSKKITRKHVENLCFPHSDAQYYRLLSSIRDGDAYMAMIESQALVSAHGYEAVDQTLFKLMSISVRNACTSFTGCVDVGENLNECMWWPDGRKSGNPYPSSFMVEVSDAIVGRHGKNGVKSILRFMCDDLCNIRIFPETRHALKLEMKIIAMCGRNGSPEITGGIDI